MLALPQHQDSWQHYTQKDEQESEFLWAGNGEDVERWNELFAGKHDIANVHATIEGTKEHFSLEYDNSKLQASVKHDRDDEMVVVVTLSRPVREVIEIRFCVDSGRFSALAFLPCRPRNGSRRKPNSVRRWSAIASCPCPIQWQNSGRACICFSTK